MRIHCLTALLLLPLASGALAVNDPEVLILRLDNSTYEGKDLSRFAHSYQALLDARHQARLGHVNSKYNLAVMYHVRGNYSEAMHWYKRAASRRHAIAAYNLGSMYYRGEGTEVDYAEAAKWIRKSADLGFADAQFHMGNLYYRGRGVPRDPAEEAKWYLKAAEAGVPEAQYNLAVLYARGEGVPQDPEASRMWLREARENGFELTDTGPALAGADAGEPAGSND